VATFASDDVRGSASAFFAARQSFGTLAAKAVVGVRHSRASRIGRQDLTARPRVVQC